MDIPDRQARRNTLVARAEKIREELGDLSVRAEDHIADYATSPDGNRRDATEYGIEGNQAEMLAEDLDGGIAKITAFPPEKIIDSVLDQFEDKIEDAERFFKRATGA